jgi:hypothetical protein
MGLACMFCFSKAFKWITYLLFVYHRDITRPRANSRSLPLPTKTLSSVRPPFSCRWFSSSLLRFQAHVPIIGIDVWEHVSHISFLFPFCTRLPRYILGLLPAGELTGVKILIYVANLNIHILVQECQARREFFPYSTFLSFKI